MQEFENLCEELNVLSDVPKDVKLYFEPIPNSLKQKVIFQSPGLITSISRTFSFGRCTKEETLTYIKKLYEDTFNMLEIMNSQKILHIPAEMSRRTMNDLEHSLWSEQRNSYERLLIFSRASLRGVENLKTTYLNDVKFKFHEDKMLITLKKHETILNDLDRYMKSIDVMRKSLNGISPYALPSSTSIAGPVPGHALSQTTSASLTLANTTGSNNNNNSAMIMPITPTSPSPSPSPSPPPSLLTATSQQQQQQQQQNISLTAPSFLTDENNMNSNNNISNQNNNNNNINANKRKPYLPPSTNTMNSSSNSNLNSNSNTNSNLSYNTSNYLTRNY